MRNVRILYLLFVPIVVALLSCAGKTKISQLVFNESITNAYLNGEAYTGTAWSDDGKSICITFDQGMVTHVEVYHSNGALAIQNSSLAGAGTNYDEYGSAISVEEFYARYPLVIKQVQNMVSNMYCSPELK